MGGVIMYEIKACEVEDIWRIRDFLKETFRLFDDKVNWCIDRLNFTYSMSRCMNSVSEEQYRKQIRIFEKGGLIEAVVLTEGEGNGEAFIEVRDHNLDDDLINHIFDFLDSLHEISKNDTVALRLNSNAKKLIQKAESLGYIKEDWSEITMKRPLNEKEDIVLPEGYSFVSFDECTYEQKALGHGKAFGYADRSIFLKSAEKGLEILSTMEDFNPELDIHILGPDGDIVAFATMWYDQNNEIGILEPVGTHPEHRKLGLAKMAIYEGCNLVLEKGAKTVYVGSDQEFYKKIGFSFASVDFVYKKVKRC